MTSAILSAINILTRPAGGKWKCYRPKIRSQLSFEGESHVCLMIFSRFLSGWIWKFSFNWCTWTCRRVLVQQRAATPFLLSPHPTHISIRFLTGLWHYKCVNIFQGALTSAQLQQSHWSILTASWTSESCINMSGTFHTQWVDVGAQVSKIGPEDGGGCNCCDLQE